jgi:hypothetical protein
MSGGRNGSVEPRLGRIHHDLFARGPNTLKSSLKRPSRIVQARPIAHPGCLESFDDPIHFVFTRLQLNHAAGDG